MIFQVLPDVNMQPQLLLHIQRSATAAAQAVVSNSRFTQSFKKGFASQEYRSLRRRVEAPLGGLPEAVCLVAVPPDGDGVVGTLDLRPPACAAGSHPKGVPKVQSDTGPSSLDADC